MLSLKPFNLVLIFALFGALAGGCSYIPPREQPDCKIQAYIESGVIDFVSTRYRKHLPVRMGVLPFLVPENFAAGMGRKENYALELTRQFQSEIVKTGEISIVELFDFGSWPGRRDDFYSGNYQALQAARMAGYDLLFVGQMEDITNDQDLVMLTKVIDVVNGVTLWHGRTTVASHARKDRRLLSSFEIIKDQPELFSFPQRSEELVRCTINDGAIRKPEADLPK